MYNIVLSLKEEIIIKKYLFLSIYLVCLITFTVYFFLDTLVISDVYEVIEDNSNTTSSEEVSTGKVETTSNTYSDDNITITLKEYYEYDTKIYVCDVKIKNISYLKRAFASNTYGKNVVSKTSDMASENNAILAINGDYYGVRQTGYVIKDGVVYRSTAAKNQEDLVIYNDGTMEIINESDITAEELVKKGAKDVFSFGPGLVDNSRVIVDENDEVGKAMASNPRTAIGYIDEGHYVFVVSDGRTSESAGLSLYQLATFMKTLGVEKAYNLDGGGSSTMVFNGTLINNPTTNGNRVSERSVSDIVYIGY